MAARERTVAMITNPPILSSNWTACSGDDFTEIDLYDFTTYDVPSGEVVDEGSQEIGP